ncbi:hypothetical protein [Mycobacterium ostraviense]|uniref:hypothetical protein n=1 Tax=Mycobacterium ostraviense TaxID=2738409 RepID=UPI001E4C4A2E|nr:hypothetical protein [Mycobacterium ostraviense]UGT90741.1 hypothetical protein LTS72_21140 [Mycobacterium ostraviense]
MQCELDLKASMIDLLDIDQPGEPLRPEVQARITSKANRATAIDAITAVLTATSEVTSAPWLDRYLGRRHRRPRPGTL